MLSTRHLMSMDDLTLEDIATILDRADTHRELNATSAAAKKHGSLRGYTIVNLFLEPSTRTRTSFEIAGKRLGADVINISGSASSIVKGESLVDTALTLDAMDTDMVVVRARAAGTPQAMRRNIRGSVVNAGDGKHEHPTQALLDLHTMRTSFGQIEGLRVAIVGDIAHSRVVGSLARVLNRMGASVVVAGPPAFMPARPDVLGVEVARSIDEALAGADVVYLLRIQLERLGSLQLLPSLREYARFWGMDERRMASLAPHTILMHPGPMNRGVEVTSEVADAVASRINDQVNSGVAVRMAVMELLLADREDLPAQPVKELLNA
ncbi:aspartate carbamoyltransferase catalytic subunit [Trueperella pecoris]|uniref:Aspartate carbamoyltransferase n=2 Tax=Trueperella pecoris TaxID=2733571 RepID=A0A7M1R399_9ACTO|nr:aspartate carbamoyltransferase catalytic subunit [Trueperella pecoris]